MPELNYEELIKAVFSNRHGDELMALWQKMYGDSLSYVQGLSSEDVAFNEGHRALFLNIKYILEDTDK
jgi:hypothetical protein